MKGGWDLNLDLTILKSRMENVTWQLLMVFLIGEIIIFVQK